MEKQEIVYPILKDSFNNNPEFMLSSMEVNSKMVIVEENLKNWRNEKPILTFSKDEEGKVFVTGQVFDLKTELETAARYIASQLL